MRSRIMLSATVTLIALVLVFGPGLDLGDAETAMTLPLADEGYVLPEPVEAFRDAMMSGGPPPDGIPSVDDPVFIEASEAELDPGDMVIGFERNGEARAYPHEILVHHEIVNDRVGGLDLAITYCPLTATAQGFERGGTTLGVSGQLVNSNLVMYDRETESYFPQLNATGVRGEHEGQTLVEVELVWTTWERWQTLYPETEVLSRDTGYLRNYDRDPYGAYNPRGGYYRNDRIIFPLMHRSDRHPPKTMVVGARTSERSAYFVIDELERERVQTTENFLAVYDRDLDSGHVYLRAGDDPEVTPRDDGRYEAGGQVHGAAELPLERLIGVEGFFFAWHAYFPDSETP